MRRCAPVLVVAALLACAGPAHAQSSGPLVTVGVDVLSATATHATYELYVANRGNAPAPDTMVTNTVPANTSYVSSDRMPHPEAGAACVAGLAAGGTCRWALGDLLPGASASVAVTYALNQTSAYTVSNTATAQIGGNAPAAEDARDRDQSLKRDVYPLDVDGHVDAGQPSKNFGACEQLDVRRDGLRTAFVDVSSSSSLISSTSNVGGAERVWSARVAAKVVSITPGATMALSLHRVDSSAWDEGSGPCAGADGTGDQLRADAQPGSEPAPAATALATGAGALEWEVAAALDTRNEAATFEGFEIRAGGTGAGGDTVSLRSSDPVSADQPTLVAVTTAPETSRCVDSDADADAGPSDQPRRLDAYVTELTSLSTAVRVEGPGGDGCPGFPLRAAAVRAWDGVLWELDDDAPDSYISSLAGVATTRVVDDSGAGPDSGSTHVDGDGRSFVEVRRGDPWEAAGDDAQIRIAAIAMRQPDPENDPTAAPGHGTPEPGELRCRSGRETVPCTGTGEATTEDDAHHTWMAPLGPRPIAAPSGESGGGESSPPPAGSAAPQPALRSVSLEPLRRQGVVGREVRLGGRLDSSAPGCAGPREYVQVLRRRTGTTGFSDFASASTEPGGQFEVPVVLDASAEYRAVAPQRPGCAAASSRAVAIVARGRVSAWTARRGARRTVRGRVLPALASRVVLERRVGRRWRRHSVARSTRRGTFAIPLRATWRGRRTFRIRWISPSRMYQGAASRSLVVPGR